MTSAGDRCQALGPGAPPGPCPTCGLVREDEGWRLDVERRGVDVLLDRLPWALSRAQTPFMAAPLTVDWR